MVIEIKVHGMKLLVFGEHRDIRRGEPYCRITLPIDNGNEQSVQIRFVKTADKAQLAGTVGPGTSFRVTGDVYFKSVRD